MKLVISHDSLVSSDVSGHVPSTVHKQHHQYNLNINGWVVGYQYISPDAVDHDIVTRHDDINSHYVDGMNTK